MLSNIRGSRHILNLFINHDIAVPFKLLVNLRRRVLDSVNKLCCEASGVVKCFKRSVSQPCKWDNIYNYVCSPVLV
jgi:hypothetical protein